MGYKKNQTVKTPQESVRFKKSVLAMCVVAMSAPAFAQDGGTETIEEILVSGTRANLQNAQDLKRNADTFVDAISADDIGSLPDRSVLEAMQRIPGVSIERFAAANDPDHVGVEGSGAVVRGMQQTRSEFNGRDSFTANSGRGLSFQDVPPELMAGVDIYKNQTADMIEGGIAGTISLRTRKPFDQDGRRIAFSADATYGDMVDEITPTVSALFSDRWDTSAGEFGFLINVSDSNLEASSHGIQSERLEFRTLAPRMRNGMSRGFEYVTTPYVYDGTFVTAGGTIYNPNPNREIEIGEEGFLIPNGASVSMKNDVRDRTGIALATQWENPDDTLLATFQFMRSDATLSWTENTIKYQTGMNQDDTWSPPGEEYAYDSRGVFRSGTLMHVGSFRGSGEDASRVPGGSNLYGFGHRFQTDARYKKLRTVVDDYAFNVAWTPSDQLELSADIQHIRAETKDDDVTLMLSPFAVMHFDLEGNGDTPYLDLANPWYFATPEEIAGIDGADQYAVGSSYFTNPSSYFFQSALDHYERSEGDSTAIRLDGIYHLDGGFFTKVKAGVRRAEREQNVRFSRYSWGAIAPVWTSDVETGWLDSQIVANSGLSNEYDVVDWSDFYRGGILAIEGGNNMLHPSNELLKDYANWGARFSDEFRDWSCAAWRPASMRVNADGMAGECEPYNINDGYFRDDEINRTLETNQAVYVRLDFETELAALPLGGNIGVRYVEITNETTGNTTYPLLTGNNLAPAGFDPYNINPSQYDDYFLFTPESRFLQEPFNYLPADAKGFANGAYVPNYAERTFDKFLPSFNLKVEFTPDVIGRFAVSKAIAMPDIGDLRNYTSISAAAPQADAIAADQPFYWGPHNPHPDTPIDPNTGELHVSGMPASLDENGDPIFNSVGNPVYYVPGTTTIAAQTRLLDPNKVSLAWTANAGNPLLMPMESTQFDASLEWYFSRVGSLTASVFYKDLSNFFFNGSYNRMFTNPISGESKVVYVSGPQNGGEGKMEGVELAYQQFYDMLPAPWDGFGVQANYSYIEANGVPNPNLNPTDTPDDLPDPDSFVLGDSVPLQGQSKHTANLVLMYEKYDWSLRLAYNWRSEYLLTSRDVITGLPVYNGDLGFLDGSIFYNVNENIQVGFQGVNLLNTQTRTYMQVDSEMKVGRSWFVNDTRYTFVVRATF